MAETQENTRTAGQRLAERRAAKAAKKAVKHTPAAPQGELDEVTRSVVEAGSWLDENQKPFWIGFAAIAIVGTVVGSFMLAGDKRNRDAGEVLEAAQRTAMSPIGEPPPGRGAPGPQKPAD